MVYILYNRTTNILVLISIDTPQHARPHDRETPSPAGSPVPRPRPAHAHRAYVAPDLIRRSAPTSLRACGKKNEAVATRASKHVAPHVAHEVAAQVRARVTGFNIFGRFKQTQRHSTIKGQHHDVRLECDIQSRDHHVQRFG